MTRRSRAPRSPSCSPATADLFTAKLEASGLGADDAARLGYRALDATAVAALDHAFTARPALVLPYHDLDGSPLADLPGAEPFYRVRYLGSETGFTATAGATKQQRYAQPKDTLACVYLPRLVDWQQLAADTAEPLIITEGELKATKACREHLPTIGLGGVWSFRSAKHGQALNPLLERFAWLRRNVYVVYDSDLGTNANVAAALAELARELGDRGAFVHVVWLPEVLGKGVKVGLDDFLVFHGEEGETELRRLLHEADLLGLVGPLLALNERYVYVASPGLLLDRKTGTKHKPGALKEHLEAPTSVFVKTLGEDGHPKHKRASAGAEWLKWPLRTQVDRITYAPGKPRFIVNGSSLYNAWSGWGCEPKKGNVKPFLQLLDHLFTGGRTEDKAWFLRWLAYPLRYPGVKLYTSALLHGRVHGTGKSLVGYTLGKIYGENFGAIKQKHLHGDFNAWAENRQFILGDDVTGSDKREDNDLLKTLITQDKIRINAKFLPEYELPDCLNYLFTSNQIDAFFLEDDDRRFFIHEVVAGKLSEEFYMDYGMWLDGEGPAALFRYLLDLDLGDFNPAAPAPLTAAKERMIADGQSDLGTWVRQLLADPDTVLRVGGVVAERDLFTNAELLALYDPERRTRVTANGLGRELRRAGAISVNEGRAFRAGDLAPQRYYALRNGPRWAAAPLAELTAHLAPSAKGRRTKY